MARSRSPVRAAGPSTCRTNAPCPAPANCATNCSPRKEGQSWQDLAAAAWDRLARLAAASPLYAQELRRRPAYAAWLTQPDNEVTEFRFRALRDEWQQMAADRAFDPGAAPLPDRLDALRAYPAEAFVAHRLSRRERPRRDP